MQDALVPLYLLHQFEVKAVAAMLGGYTYRYALRDEEKPEPVPITKQRQALQALVGTLDTEMLWPDAHIVGLMSPRPPSYAPSDESFSGATGQIFDALRPVEEATSITIGEILQPERAARLADAIAEDPNALGLDEVLTAIISHTWKSPAQQGFAGSAQRAIAMTVLRSLLTGAVSKTSPMAVRGAYLAALDELLSWNRMHPPAPGWKDAYAFAAHAVEAVEHEPGTFEVVPRRALVLDPMGEFDAR
jgi:Met-zincin